MDQIFKEQGEEAFRELEKRTLGEVLNKSSSGRPLFIALGAGFSGELSFADEVIWIRRESDKDGRIFLDRPKLNPELSPLEEWRVRYEEREEKYTQCHTQVLTLPEGSWLTQDLLKCFISNWFPQFSSDDHRSIPYDATLLAEDLKKDRFQNKTFYKSSRRIEVREDLIPQIPNSTPAAVYFSHRKPESGTARRFEFEDWDLSLGKPKEKFWSYSLHEGRFEDSFVKTLPAETVLKWAPEIHSFQELLYGHRWFLQDPKHRAFLPRSTNGRWRWYRRLFGPQMPIHFVRDDKGSSIDQPFWYETCLPGLQGQGFAAVLGGSVSLSWSPSFHADFFKKYKMPFVSIDLSEEEFSQGLSVLKTLGLRAAAVTSPLKRKSFEQVTDFIKPSDKELFSINTLFFKGERTLGINTDLPGVQKATSGLLKPTESTVIWGGGGLKPTLEKAFPQAVHAKARKGMEINENSTILWASTRSREVVWPKPIHQVKRVLDMNYFESSMGRELALIAGADYVSGERFFIEQAKLQQEFWSQNL